MASSLPNSVDASCSSQSAASVVLMKPVAVLITDRGLVLQLLLLCGGRACEREAEAESQRNRGGSPEGSQNAGFEAADLDGDGSLGPEEFLQAAMRDAAGRGSGPRQEARLAIFRSLDDEGDGVISRKDFMTRAAARFAASDTDGDGALPVWEFLAILRF